MRTTKQKSERKISMMNFLKRSLSLMMVVIIISTLCISTFAANKTYSYSTPTTIVTKTVEFSKGLGTNKITVVNNGSSRIDVYIGGIYRGQLRQGQQLTTAHYGNAFSKTAYSVKVHVRDRVYGKQTYRIMTTSRGSIR